MSTPHQEYAADCPTNPFTPPVSQVFAVEYLFSEFQKIGERGGDAYLGPIQQGTALQNRWQQGKFYFAILGQFKRGKSTFINALLGEPLLPTAVIPLTAIPTFIQHGAERTLEVQFSSDLPPIHKRYTSKEALSLDLQAYVTEEGNPNNKKNVSHVLVHHPCSFCSHGIILIDTPGIGSAYRHNTEATLQFLPKCDAAVFLISSDPPITETELDFLKTAHNKISRLFYIINKADYLSDTERGQFIKHFREVLLREGIESTLPPIFCISAKQGLEAKLSEDKELWKTSGLERVETYLTDFLMAEKNDILTESIFVKLQSMLMDFHLQVLLEIKSLQLPISDLEHRLKLFRDEITKMERERTILHDLLAGELHRLILLLEEQAAALRKKAISYLYSILNTEIPGELNVLESTMMETIAQYIPSFFEKEMGELVRNFESRISQQLKPFQQRANDLLNTIKTNAASIFDIPLPIESTLDFYKIDQQPNWVTHKWSTSFIPIPIQWFESFLPKLWRDQRAKRRIEEQIEALVLHNVENLRWTTLQNLNSIFRHFSDQISTHLQESISVTQVVIEKTLLKRLENDSLISKELEQKEALADELHRLISIQQTLEPSQKGNCHASKD